MFHPGCCIESPFRRRHPCEAHRRHTPTATRALDVIQDARLLCSAHSSCPPRLTLSARYATYARSRGIIGHRNSAMRPGCHIPSLLRSTPCRFRAPACQSYRWRSPLCRLPARLLIGKRGVLYSTYTCTAAFLGPNVTLPNTS